MTRLRYSKPGFLFLVIASGFGFLIFLTVFLEFYAWRHFGTWDNISLTCSNGSIGVVKSDVYPPLTFGGYLRFRRVSKWDWRFALWPRYKRGTNTLSRYRTFLFLPFWIPMMLSALISLSFYRRVKRRSQRGFCIKCDYNLTGNTSGVCPECGERI